MLDYIVVDTFAQSEDALLFLKQQAYGRAGFIALDRLGNVNIRDFAPPAHCVRLFDKVHISQQVYEKAFYLAMGDTCACSFLETAL